MPLSRLNAIQFGSTVYQVRGKTGINGGLPFSVLISPRASVPLAKVEKMLGLMAAALGKTPYYSYLKTKQVQIWVVTKSDLRQLGYVRERNPRNYDYASPELTTSLLPEGVYEPFYNAVLLEESTVEKNLAAGNASLLVHELLHGYSTVIRESGPGLTVVKSGIMKTRLENSRQTNEHRYLNEGITEYLRVQTGGVPPIGLYRELFDAAEILASQLGGRTLSDAYFRNDPAIISAPFDLVHGPGSFAELSQLADYAGSLDRTSQDIKMLLGHARYGQVFQTMLDWGYSPESMRRAPRQLSPAELPPALRTAIGSNKMLVYTNLTPRELAIFTRNLGDQTKHVASGNEFSFAHFRHLPAILADEFQNGRQLVTIRYSLDYNQQPWAKLDTGGIKPEWLGSLVHLGKIREGRFLCDILLT
ncbi:MAG: hypothetical protein WC529_08410 [Candidatus Margulisiibacteriota bacterium]